MSDTAETIEKREEAANPAAAAPSAALLPEISAKALGANQTGKSWGEKYGTKTIHFIRDIFLNYIVNFVISAIITYKWEMSATGKKLSNWIGVQAGGKIVGHSTEGAIVEGGSAIKKFIFGYFTRAQCLMMGGRALLPIMHWSHNHQKELEFRAGHMLDSIQEFVGSGDAASRRSLEEYNRIAEVRSRADKPVLTPKDKALLAEHKIGEDLRFQECPRGWWKTLKARLAGEVVTTSMAIMLGLLSSRPKDSIINFQERLEKPIGNRLGKYGFGKIPYIGSRIVNPEKFGYFFVDEMLFTAGSCFGFRGIERKQAKALQEQEAALAGTKKADISADNAFLSQTGVCPEVEAIHKARDKHAARIAPHERAAPRNTASLTERRERERAGQPEASLAIG